MNLSKSLLISCMASIACTLPAWADTVAYVVTSNQQFGTFDISTGSFTVIGPGTPEAESGLVPGPNGGLLTLTASGSLDTINPATGQVISSLATGLGNCSAPVAGQCGPNSANTLAELNGVVYATDYQNNLYKINTTTGAATLVAATGVPAVPKVPFSTNPDGSLNFYGEALFASNGNLFATFFTGTLDPDTFEPTPAMPDYLYKINPTTGATTVVDPSTPTAFGLDSVANFNGVYYAFANSSGQVDILNLTNASTMPVATYDPGATGLIFGATPVPEPISFGLTFVSLAGILGMKGRKAFLRIEVNPPTSID